MSKLLKFGNRLLTNSKVADRDDYELADFYLHGSSFVEDTEGKFQGIKLDHSITYHCVVRFNSSVFMTGAVVCDYSYNVSTNQWSGGIVVMTDKGARIAYGTDAGYLYTANGVGTLYGNTLLKH